MSHPLDPPYWIDPNQRFGLIVPWSGEIVPVEPGVGVDPGGDFPTWEQELQNVKNNVQFLGKTVTTPVHVIVNGAESLWNGITHLFADPQPSPAPPVVTPDEEATVPAPDPLVIYTGAGPVPQWVNVYGWAVDTAHALTPDVDTPAPISGTQVRHAIDTTAGQTIKAVSGPINQVLNITKFTTALLHQQITDTQNVIGALANDQNLTNAQIHAVLDPLVNNVLPTMQDEVTRLRQDVIDTATGVITITQKWATDNIHTPLSEDLAAEKANRIAQVDDLKLSIPGIVHDIIAGAGLAPAATVAALAGEVAKLTQESTDCTQPMCDTMGPNTNLGKLLKALQLAADAALFAEIASLTEPELVAFIKGLVGHFAALVSDFEGYFSSGSETLGDLFKNAGLSAL